METRKQMILDALGAFVRQRSGIEWRNYYSNWTDTEGVKAFRAEQRSIAKDLQQYRILKRSVELRDSITANDLVIAFRDAYSGRLTLSFREIATKSGPAGGAILNYCTGQYFPTEYRRAACAVMASALWVRKREDMPAPIGKANRNGYECDTYAFHGNGKSPDAMSAGDWLRASFRKEFGCGIASRWFS